MYDKPNSKVIRDRMTSVALTKGCIVGCLVGIAFLLFVYGSDLRMKSIDTILWILLLFAVCVVAEYGSAMRSFKRVVNQIAVAEKETGTLFDQQEFLMLGESGTLFISPSWLMYHERDTYQFWAKENIHSIQPMGSMTKGNAWAVCQLITKDGKPPVSVLYQLKDNRDIFQDFIQWLEPVMQDPSSNPIPVVPKIVVPTVHSYTTPTPTQAAFLTQKKNNVPMLVGLVLVVIILILLTSYLL